MNINKIYIEHSIFVDATLCDLIASQLIRHNEGLTNDYDALCQQRERIVNWKKEVEKWAKENNHTLPTYQELKVAIQNAIYEREQSIIKQAKREQNRQKRLARKLRQNDNKW